LGVQAEDLPVAHLNGGPRLLHHTPGRQHGLPAPSCDNGSGGLVQAIPLVERES